MLPRKVLYGMAIIIDKKHINKSLRWLKYENSTNTFTWSDGICLFQYTPEEIMPVHQDFYLSRHQIKALEAMTTPTWEIRMRGTDKTVWGINLMQFSWDTWLVYMPVLSEISQYPEIQQETLFWSQWVASHVATNDYMNKFVKVGMKINQSWLAVAHERAFTLQYEETGIWSYFLAIAKPKNPDEEIQK